jgi:hypothetical protein
MTPPEDTYLQLVGAEGHAKAARSFDIIVQEQNQFVLVGARKLFFLALLNAYYRGVNNGVDQARSALANARRNARGDQSGH